MNGKIIFCSLLLWGPGLLLAQAASEQLEERLSLATGRERLELLVELVGVYRRQAPERAITLGQEAQGLLPSYSDDQLELELASFLRSAYQRNRQYQLATEQGSRAVLLARTLGDVPRLARALDRLADTYLSLNAFELSLKSALEALPLYTQLEDWRQLCDLTRDIAVTYNRLGNPAEALEQNLAAYRACDNAGDRSGLGWAMNGIGIANKDLKNLPQALESYQEALSIFEREGNENAIAAVLNNIGNVYRLQGDPKGALEVLYPSLEIKERLGLKRGIGIRHHNIGYAYQALGDLDRANEHYRKALEIRQDLDDQQGIANTLQHIAMVHSELGRYRLAVQTLKRSLAIATPINVRDEILDAHRDLSTNYAAMGRYREAFEASRAHEKLEGEIFNEKSQRVVAEMQTRFESERNEKEIQLLLKQQQLDALELRQRGAIRQALSAGLILLASITLLTFNRYRFQSRSARVIKRQHHELERSLADLKESEQVYRQLFDDPSRAQLLVDPTNREVITVNASAAKLLGRSVTSLAGQSLSSQEGDWPVTLDRLQETENEASAEVKIFQIGQNPTRQFEAWVSRLQIDGREAMLLTLHDVTEHRRLEEERLRRKERERYITEIESEQAKVEVRNQEWERFAYSVSHELKTPLVTIRGFLGQIEADIEAGLGERALKDLDRIDVASHKMGSLLDDLLELSRIGRIRQKPKSVTVASLAEQAAAEAVKAGFKVELASDLPVVVADPSRLFEVFQQLIDNAVKFMGNQPAPRIEVGCRRTRDETTIYVRDNGMGIAAPYRDKIFGLFDQLDPEVTGTGIGLAIVERVVETHGGRAWVESEGPGRGSTFCFTLGPTCNTTGQPQLA